MKTFKDVEANRKAYHSDGAKNSIHRASLLVPELDGALAEISFLNHFLIKRENKHVACRVSAIGPDGKRIESRLIGVDEPKVYTIPLTGMVDETVSTYMVEFFTDQNLFFPFPAVMINHHGDGFMNCVHAFNRVLNDTFEDDEIGAHHPKEAAIDVRVDDTAETFLLFYAGPQDVESTLDLELLLDGRSREATAPLKIPKLCYQRVPLREVFSDIEGLRGGVLKVQQPKQFLFYGRMFVGQSTPDGSFSANHSYYDNSTFAEYWDDARPSSRLYPFFGNLENRVRFYPILSPGRLNIAIEIRSASGQCLTRSDLGFLDMSEDGFIDVSVNDVIRDAKLASSDVRAFALIVTPTEGNTPTRVNHQVVYHADGLESSINVSLVNPNLFVPPGKKGLTWGQFPIGRNLDSYLGATFTHLDGEDADLSITMYNGDGVVAEEDVSIPGGAAAVLRPEDIFDKNFLESLTSEPEYTWFEIRSERPDISAFTVVRNRHTGHCTGEHSF